MEVLEEDLTCAVCYSLFSDPRVLPCSHTFCKSCLDTLLQLSSNYNIWRPLRQPLKCPNCRNVAELPLTGTEGLPSNVSLKAIIEKYQRDGHPRGLSCDEHPQQPLNMYCVQDRQLICGLCLTVGQHQGHPIDDLQAAYIREKETPQLLARLSEKKFLQICELTKQLELKKEQCEVALQQDRQKCLQFFQRLETTLANKKIAYLNVIDKTCTEVAHAYDPLIYKVKAMQEEQLDLVTLGSAVEEEDSALVFLEKVHVFKDRVEEFIQTPLPSVLSLSVNTQAADFLHTHWTAVTISSLEEAPVPKMSFCTRCNSQSFGMRSWLYYLCTGPLICVLSLGLMLLSFFALWNGEWLGFSLLSSISQVVNQMSAELLTSVWNSTEALLTEIQMSHLVTNGQQAFQELVTFLKSLTCWY